METALLSPEKVGELAQELYDNSIEQEVVSAENIGKMVIIDIQTGDYEVDEDGLSASERLNERHPDGALFGIRIGYNVAASLGGMMERVGK
jgi:hypothetical protein